MKNTDYHKKNGSSKHAQVIYHTALEMCNTKNLSNPGSQQLGPTVWSEGGQKVFLIIISLIGTLIVIMQLF